MAPQKPPPRAARSGGKPEPERGDRAARPDMDRLLKEDEIRSQDRDQRPDKPDPSALTPDSRTRCIHGRLFSCLQCDDKLQEEKFEAKRLKLKPMLDQFHRSCFNIAAIIIGDDNVQLTPAESGALADSGSSAVAYVAPEASLGVLGVIGYITTLGGCITGKILDAEKAGNGKPGAGDRGDKAVRKDDAGAGASSIRIG